MSLPADDEFELTEQVDLDEAVDEARGILSERREGRVPAGDDEAAPLRGEGEAADGKVHVVTRTGGVVDSVYVDPRAMRAGPEQLGQQLAEALNQALDQVRDHAAAGQGAGASIERVEETLTYAEDVAMERFGMYADGLDDALVRIERFAEED